jgi:ornithine cyclodeaminase/alanine dehydrogenase-like protein (mu-crystallin family)
MRILSKTDIKKCLTMREAIDVMADAFSQLAAGDAIVPQRSLIEIPDEHARVFFMPGHAEKSRVVGLKVVTSFDDNRTLGLPSIQAVVMIMDAADGRPLALLDGEYLTALRTGAGSGLATSLLANPDAEIAVIMGAGVQARTQLQAVCAAREIKKAYIYNRTLERATQFVEEMAQKLPIVMEVAVSREHLRQADVICTATDAVQPLFSNAIGAYRSDMVEIPAETIVDSKIIVDQISACLHEAGDIIQPMQRGIFTETDIHAELGELVLGKKVGRVSEDEITVFKSVGNAVQDLVTARYVLDNALQRNFGTEIDL